MRFLKICALAALMFSSSVMPASAGLPGDDDFDDRLLAAEAVFEGTIESVRFVESQGDAGEPGVPHTFVTYRVERVFKGRVRGETVTLRFFGGLDSTGDELTMASNAPTLDRGDHDVVLVAGNGAAECPLIGCSQGRFRVIGGAVYDEGGRDLVAVGREGFRRGEPRDLPEVFRWSSVGLEMAFDERPRPADPDATMSAELFRDLVARRLAAVAMAGDPVVEVVSVDPARPFVYAHPVAVAPPADPADDPAGGAAGGPAGVPGLR